MQLSVKDVAKLLNVTEKTIYRWIKQESIPAYRINEQCRFNRAEILEWATSRRIPFSPEILTESSTEPIQLPTLTETLQTGGIVYRLEGDSKPTVLRGVVDVMRLPEEVDREFLYQVLLARENLGSTGVGDGIAIPHVRNPIVLHITKPIITLCFLEHPIDFGALDGTPVDTLFTLISPTVRAHLHLLSRLSFVLQNTSFKQALKRQALRDELMEELTRAEAALPVITSLLI
ncbi:MAG: PTS sugar transporter subunit IIA [Kiritimatiellae bacterium]|nr:PTS sugar transporter subunit IIA [Kiritimatiellia bacterium]